ncbi:GGDEF domain-containing protein [Capilliphycus salinus ALCB114379]|uniref:GGDEF domain-containing protein n=1 Tax=Capilliphycus salinus TaxID=2768948 RepID=UPI0039A67D5B
MKSFSSLLPTLIYPGATALAEALRQQLADHEFTKVGHQTGSFGVAEFHEGSQSISHLISQVDEALYKAKERGRNCVVAYQKTQTM